MKKIVRQQNYLKELIETQGNRFLSRQALKCLVRSALEVLLDNPEDGVVLYRIENKDSLQGLLKRLEYSDIPSYSYADDSKNLVEKIEFLQKSIDKIHTFQILIFQEDAIHFIFVQQPLNFPESPIRHVLHQLRHLCREHFPQVDYLFLSSFHKKRYDLNVQK